MKTLLTALLISVACVSASAQSLSPKTTRQICSRVAELVPILYTAHQEGTSQDVVETNRVRVLDAVKSKEISAKFGVHLTNLLYWTDVQVAKTAPMSMTELETTKLVVSLCNIDPLSVVLDL